MFGHLFRRNDMDDGHVRANDDLELDLTITAVEFKRFQEE